MESVKKANARLRNYPLLMGKCAEAATKYAACVTKDFNVGHKSCQSEFDALKVCLERVAKNLKTRL
ncbi:uncharacterized protein LOC129795113 [Lutzomyia longipalpis]|uniref:uncharacterized protein LOC129795113 n=1 Tax=Lutzomyia longipalpis TaxID=7200 RepID=UPI002483CF18|nr:uncharacterized protein LOC129795113 [Lutzomyia longipalpis]